MEVPGENAAVLESLKRERDDLVNYLKDLPNGLPESDAFIGYRLRLDELERQINEMESPQ